MWKEVEIIITPSCSIWRETNVLKNLENGLRPGKNYKFPGFETGIFLAIGHDWKTVKTRVNGDWHSALDQPIIENVYYIRTVFVVTNRIENIVRVRQMITLIIDLQHISPVTRPV